MIRLSRSLKVFTFDVEATVALGQDRPEFLAVARLAADLGRPIGAHVILRELLGDRPEVLGWRVIERCVALGLLERERSDGPASLSVAGRLALEHGEVLVPEEGIWRLYVVDDPLVTSPLVHASRLESEPVYLERNAMRAAQKRGDKRVQPDRVPDVLRRCVGGPVAVSKQNGHLFKLVEIAGHGAVGPSSELRLTLDWPDEVVLRLSGQLPHDDQVARHKPMDAVLELPSALAHLTYEAMWKRLAAVALGLDPSELDRWHAQAGKPVVPVPFQSLPPEARRSFLHDLEVPASALPALGRFDPTVLKAAPAVPPTAADAQRWLEWLQWESIDDYALPRGLEQMGRDLAARFPLHRPRPLTPIELLSKARAERDPRAWFLLAPSDLGLWS
jgi:hypothetical protein